MVTKQYDVIVIGAGASGLMCAATCGKRGRRVLVLDHAARTCSKVRVSGGGRCNFTNQNADARHYESHNSHFCKSALARFTPTDMIGLIRKHHVLYYEKEAGQFFCRTSSRKIVDLLERECAEAGAEIRLKTAVASVAKDRLFSVTTDNGIFTSGSLVVATGGLSYANLGATSFGHKIAKTFGLALVPPRPALVPFLFPQKEQRAFGTLAGISLGAEVRTGGKSFHGNILFTHRGLSGPAALQASLYWQQRAGISIDLLPGVDIDGLFASKRRSRMELRNILAAVLPKRFVEAWLDASVACKPLTECSNRDLRELADGLHTWNIVPAGTEGYKTAEVTAGGVATDELSSKTMEARKVPGLYFIGEVVDVTGELGGYNLHWAWASGHAAGEHA